MGSQVFKPNANSIAHMTIIAIAVLPLTVGLALAALSRSPANTKVGVAKNQPVPFSHQHHNWELGIDCRYCHTSVEKSSYAGIPATETCMSCHSQIWTNSPLLEPIRQSYDTGVPIKWNKVNKVPDFVFFNHSIHINRGLNCNTCHVLCKTSILRQKAMRSKCRGVLIATEPQNDSSVGTRMLRRTIRDLLHENWHSSSIGKSRQKEKAT